MIIASELSESISDPVLVVTSEWEQAVLPLVSEDYYHSVARLCLAKTIESYQIKHYCLQFIRLSGTIIS